MLKKKTNTKKVIIIVSALILIGLVVGGFAVYRHYQKSKPIPNKDQAQQVSTETTSSQTPSTENQDKVTSTQNQTTPQASNNIPAPSKPTFTKSSGNNGPVPSNITIDFTCFADFGTTCSIILVSGGKQTILGPSAIKDNGRGQYFVNFYWQSVKGKYTVTAESKNSQGGVSSSNQQALEVQ